MTTFTWVQRPDYVIFDSEGNIKEMFCKVCGDVIAAHEDRLKERKVGWGGKIIEVRQARFTRKNNYCELKMEFQDGSAHVTNGCTKCLHPNLSTDQLYELHRADLLLDGGQHTVRNLQRVPIEAVAIRQGGGGIE